jgi:hypothetical protein
MSTAVDGEVDRNASALRQHLPLLQDGRPLKRWRYVAVFCEELMACAARVRVGPASQSFWALLTRSDGRLRERTRTIVQRTTGGPAVVLGPGRMSIRERDVRLELELDEGIGGIEARCAHPGGGEVWTRKQAGIGARGTLTLAGARPLQVQALAVIDDTAGYHARRTEWWWSAGVGNGPNGERLAWNLVSGVNDPAHGSERAVWMEGVPNEPAPVSFAPDLSEISASDRSRLHFTPEAQRKRKENLLLISSDYTAPFGHFQGTLPGGIELAHGLGVVEHHRARW